MGISVTKARILTLFFTNIFLGIHLVTFGVSLYTQLWKNPANGRPIKRLLVAVTLAMGIIGMLDAGLDVALNIKVWTSGNVSLFSDVAYWINVVKDSDKAIQPLIGDGILTYRCWVVWERRWQAIVVSTILWFAGLAVSIAVIAKSAMLKGFTGINAPSLTPFLGAAYTLTVALNILTTSLIVYRIWIVSRDVRRYIAGQDKLTYIIRIIIESGALYSITALVTLLTAVSKSNADYIMGNALVQMTGICFNLIIIRFDQNLADRNQVISVHTTSRSPPVTTVTSGGRRKTGQVHAVPMIHIVHSQSQDKQTDVTDKETLTTQDQEISLPPTTKPDVSWST
ncbi:hypothetical protein OBBRIDRAFT_487581 [Obba rivulosa]|uniref:Transmembrane protein n=1 Tax=Obba rivulosa TaxID=1052685 RepID=A0A8E2AX31_9APHY|nr:hypothetical protein OBBRIDRAFT_487581 [Obba rivulosa]